MVSDDCTVYELRRYTLHPGTREDFVTLFETYLLDSQDEAGMRVLGQFRDLDRPDAFVWLRAFADMDRRKDALTEFYYGPVWKEHRDAANAMMIDSDDVLLLGPAVAGRHLAAHAGARPPAGTAPDGSAEFEVVVTPLRPEDTTGFAERFAAPAHPVRGERLPALVRLHAANTFPQLPVHEDRHVAVTITRYTDSVPQTPTTALDDLATGPVERLRLRPTARSALR